MKVDRSAHPAAAAGHATQRPRPTITSLAAQREALAAQREAFAAQREAQALRRHAPAARGGTAGDAAAGQARGAATPAARSGIELGEAARLPPAPRLTMAPGGKPAPRLQHAPLPLASPAATPVRAAMRPLAGAPPTAAETPRTDKLGAHDLGADDFDWDDVLVLPRAAVRVRSPLRYAVSRSVKWGNGRRNLAVAGLLACCALTAACGSASRLAQPDVPTTALAGGGPVREDGRQIPAPARVAGLRADRTRFSNRAEPIELQTAGRTADLGPAAPELEEPAPSPRTADPSLTQLVSFRSAPFPYEGATGEGTPFLNVVQGDQRGHRGRRGQVLWEGRTFSDSRALVHVPARFDPSQPGALVVFFHGYGATLERDVGARQQVPQQVTASGANAVLVAPQFASDARDPSAGHFWEPGGCARFLNEAAQRIAETRGIAPAAIARMPLVFIPYSGGFYTAALCLKDPAIAHRTRTVLMLDAAYGDLETYADWAASRPGNSFVSGYTHFTARQNSELRGLLAARGVPIRSQLSDGLSRGGATFLPADTAHNDYVTEAWTDRPIRDLLMRMPGLHGRDPQAIAAADMTPTGSIR